MSGDLTQRARARQLEAARAFLDRIPFPKLVVPGNHDIPLFDLFRRFLLPLERYRRLIAREVNQFWRDEELAVLGLNTARSNVWKDGRISFEQIALIRERLCPLPPEVFRAIVTHHPFIPPPEDPSPAVVGRGFLALQAAEACGVDLVLAGHLHVGYTGDVRSHHQGLGRSILAAHAGTAISTRLRQHPNGYNVIAIEPPRLAFEARAWDGARFTAVAETRYVKRGEEWLREGREAAPQLSVGG